MLRVIDFAPSHARAISLNEGYDASVLANYVDMNGFFAETIIDGEFNVIGIISGCMIMRTTFEVSALVSVEARKYPIEFTKLIQARLFHYCDELSVCRVQCTVRAGFPFLQKFIELIGFEKEGLMRKFGPEGDDYFLYSRVKE